MHVPASSGASSSRAASATIFRFFPPLATLDRVNHVAAIAGWLGLTLGVVLAVTYSLAYHELNLPQLVWGDRRMAGGDVHRARPRVARMAGAARGASTRARRSSRCSCCTSRSASRSTGGGPVPVSAYPLMLEGAALSAVVVGGGAVATRKATALRRRRCARFTSSRRRSRRSIEQLAARQRSPFASRASAIRATHIGDALLVVAATDDAAIERRSSPRDARARGPARERRGCAGAGELRHAGGAPRRATSSSR